MSAADDFGRFHASPATLRGACWPVQPMRVTEKQIAAWLDECVRAGLIRTYEADGLRFLVILDFRQQTRTKKSRFPDPATIPTQACIELTDNMLSNCTSNDKQLPSDCEASDEHLISNGTSNAKQAAAGRNGSAGPEVRQGDKHIGSRLKIDAIPDEWREWSRTELRWSDERCRRVFADFRDYWTAKAGEGARKVDWFATWRVWCRRENMAPERRETREERINRELLGG